MIDSTEITRIAALAKLDMGNGSKLEEETIAINKMMEIVDQIKSIPLNVDSYALNMELVNTLRDDTPVPSLLAKDVLANAPEIEAGCISVPKILGREE